MELHSYKHGNNASLCLNVMLIVDNLFTGGE
jgi:hypothetical protein